MTTDAKHNAEYVGNSDSHPTKDKSNTTARFWNRMAERYAAKPVANQEVYARKLAITREYLHPDSEVLELGCGTGSTALVHARYVKHIRATDFSSKMIEIAQRKASTMSISNVDFVCSTVNNAGVPETRYDVILALSLLHLLEDWSGTIHAVSRMLKPGGVFVTSTVCMGDDHAWLRLISPVGRSVGLLPQLSFFTRTELENVMIDACFDIEHAWKPSPRTGLFLVARKTQ